MWMRKVEGVFETLGWFLGKATGAKPPPPMEFVTITGVVIPTESKDVMAVLHASALPDQMSYCTDNLAIHKMQEDNWRAGVEPGAQVVVVYETGMGWVAARAKVRLAIGGTP